MNLIVAVAEGELALWAHEAGHTVSTTATGVEARHRAVSGSADAVVFDPALAGDRFPAELRGDLPQVAVLAWLPAYSSIRATELLERGSDDVLHGAIQNGRRWRGSTLPFGARVDRRRRPASSSARCTSTRRTARRAGETSRSG